MESDTAWVAGIARDMKEEVELLREDLVQLSRSIHATPELRFEEHESSKLIQQYLKKQGFSVTGGIADMPTAFRAERRFGTGGPTIGVFCEYDALPDIGHACGHNIIASAGAGAGVAASSWLEKNGVVNAKVVVMGSPGEEGGGGKVFLINAGQLKDFDAMAMVHPSGYNAVDRPNLGRISLEFSFTGKPSHAAAAPDLGVNALDAATLMLVAVGLLRQQLRPDSRLHAIIVDGGQSVNIIPERAKVKLFIRSADETYLRERMLDAVSNCAKGCALATGCTVEIEEVAPAYQPIITNPVLGSLAATAFETIGRPIDPLPNKPTSAGSTDMGNVSRVVPSVHGYISVSPGLVIHTHDFEEAAGSEVGDEAVVDGAAMLATVVASLATHPELVDEAKAAFDLQTSSGA